MDGLDPESVAAAVGGAEPDVIVHQLTALGGDLDLGNFEKTFEETSRLRTEGTDHLLSAARAVGARRFVAQSFAGWPYAKTGDWVKAEDAPLDQDPPEAARTALEAVGHLEAAVVGAGEGIEGIVLRYGGFYGPNTSMATDPDGEQTEMVRKRRMPIIGNGQARWSLVHITDAATATVAAIEHGAPGIYNIVDDEPAPVGEMLPVLAAAIGAKPPRHVPVWLGRIVARIAAGPGAADVMVAMMQEARGASNEKAKRDLGWNPHYPSWRQGFREGLSKAPRMVLPSRDGATL